MEEVSESMEEICVLSGKCKSVSGIVTEVREVLKSMNIYNLTSSCGM